MRDHLEWGLRSCWQLRRRGGTVSRLWGFWRPHLRRKILPPLLQCLRRRLESCWTEGGSILTTSTTGYHKDHALHIEQLLAKVVAIVWAVTMGNLSLCCSVCTRISWDPLFLVWYTPQVLGSISKLESLDFERLECPKMSCGILCYIGSRISGKALRSFSIWKRLRNSSSGAGKLQPRSSPVKWVNQSAVEISKETVQRSKMGNVVSCLRRMEIEFEESWGRCRLEIVRQKRNFRLRKFEDFQGRIHEPLYPTTFI